MPDSVIAKVEECGDKENAISGWEFHNKVGMPIEVHTEGGHNW